MDARAETRMWTSPTRSIFFFAVFRGSSSLQNVKRGPKTPRAILELLQPHDLPHRLAVRKPIERGVDVIECNALAQ